MSFESYSKNKYTSERNKVDYEFLNIHILFLWKSLVQKLKFLFSWTKLYKNK